MIQQQQLLDDAGRLLLQEMRPGEDLSLLRYETKVLVGYVEHIVHIEEPDGVSRPARVPLDLMDVVDSLRDVMYQPGSGTWFSAAIIVSRTDGASADFNYDNEPSWETPPIDPVLYVQDLEKYPRDDVAIPDWLRRRLGEAERGSQD